MKSGSFWVKLAIAAGVVLFVYVFLNPYYLFPDGQGYFSYLPSMFFDRDLQLYNDFVNMHIPIPLALSPTGYISNNWPAGTAFFSSPFYLAAKLFAEPSYHQYSWWYWLWVNSGTVFYGLLAFYLLLQMLKLSGLSGKNDFLLSCLAFLGTPAFFYFFTISATSHGVTAFCASVFIWYWLYSMREPDKIGRYILLGLILGIAAMVRTQEALLGLAVAGELSVRAVMDKRFKELLKLSAVLIASFIIGLSPQLFMWKILNGSFFAAPSKFNLSSAYFSPMSTLFSSYHGILLWTPVYFTAFAGLVLGLRRDAKIYLGLLLVFLAQFMVNSSIVAFWEGHAFGLRQMTSLLPVVLLGIAAFLDYFKDKDIRLKKAAWLLVILPCAWTAGLLLNTYLGLDLMGYLAPSQLFKAQLMLLPGIPRIVGKFFNDFHPDTGTFIAILCTGAVFLWIAYLLKRSVETGKAWIAAGALFAAVLVFNIMIFKAHANKPAYEIPKQQTISVEELDKFFAGQVQDIKNKYGLK